MTYVVCQTPKCQQTYPIKNFKKDDKNIKCEKCGGVLIDKNGRANLSQHATVIPVITPEEIKENYNDRLKQKHEKMAELQNEITELKEEGQELFGNDQPVGQNESSDQQKQPKKTLYMYTCESGCGHTTIIDKFYKTKRVFCGVCGTKSTMKYQGECTVDMLPKQPFQTKNK